jgi:hypothetical protein
LPSLISCKTKIENSRSQEAGRRQTNKCPSNRQKLGPHASSNQPLNKMP